METPPKPTATEQLQTAKTAAADKFAAFKVEAGQHLDSAVAQLDQLKDQLMAQAQQAGKDMDIDGLKVKAAAHFETAKATTAETLANLQAQAEAAYASASVKADELSDIADDKLDELKAEAAVHLDAAQVKLDELKAEAVYQIEAAKEKAKGMWHQVFGE